MFGQTTTYELTLTKNYVAGWGMVQAVRELIQNALDSDSPFVYEFRANGESEDFYLTSEFATLSPQTLLLGATSKADNADAIGSFGEGYKIALLVLTRLGYEVELRNGDVVWRPRFRFSRQFKEDLLIIEESASTDKTNRGLTFVLRGINPAEREEIVASCLQMQPLVGQLKTTSLGDILLDRPGKLYVGGLHICATELKHGYNIKPEHIRLERDRQTVDNWDLKSITKAMWLETGETAQIVEMIDAGTPDMEYVRYDCPEVVKEACYALFRERHPGALVAESHSEMKELIANGMKEVIIVRSDMYHAVSTSRSYRTEIPAAIRATPHALLRIWLVRHRAHLRTKGIVAFKELMEVSKSWRN